MARDGGAPRFLCDAMLGRLARWLRVLGYDCRYADLPDDALVDLARAEGRILLTRDTGLARRRDVDRLGFVRHDGVHDQVRQLVADFGLDAGRAAGTRCPACNGALEPLPAAAAAGRVPPHVWRTHQEFSRCPGCGRIYWRGTHWEHMALALRGLQRLEARTEGRGSRTG